MARSSQCNIYRRHSPNGQDRGESTGPHSHYTRPTRGLGLPNQLPKITVGASSDNRFPGVPDGLQISLLELARGKGDPPMPGGSENPENGMSICETAGTVNWEALSGNSDCAACSTPLQEPTEVETPSDGNRGGYDRKIYVSPQARQDLEWWSVNFPKWNWKQLRPPPHSLEKETDASQVGWRACCEGILTGGCWSTAESTLHINAQELLAALYGVIAFTQDHSNLRILLLTDNMTTVPHINRQVTDPGSDRVRALALVPRLADNSGGSPPARSRERSGGLHVKTPRRPLRLEAQPTLILTPESAVGSIRG